MNPGPIINTSNAILQYMPLNLQGLINPTDFMLCSGITGILCSFLIGLIWSRGL